MAKQNEPTPRELVEDMQRHVSGQAVPVEGSAPVQQRRFNLDYASLANEAMDSVEGFDLVKGDAKGTLIGVPFIIVGATYRPGIAQGQRKANYVSLELVTADDKTLSDRLRAGRILNNRGEVVRELLVNPNETLVINDGSTGIARQVTEYLHLKGLINVGAIPAGTPTGGEMGTSPYDRYFEEWPAGGDAAGKGLSFLLKCPRGLRVSEYQNPAGGKELSQTYYLG